MATTTDTHNVALTEGFAIDGETSAPAARTPFLPMTLPFAHEEIVSLNCEVTLLRKIVSEYVGVIARKDTRFESLTLTVRDLESAIYKRDDELVAASEDAEKHLDNARDLSRMLDDSGKREDRAHETLMGIRALAESDGLSDHEKVALILRLA